MANYWYDKRALSYLAYKLAINQIDISSSFAFTFYFEKKKKLNSNWLFFEKNLFSWWHQFQTVCFRWREGIPISLRVCKKLKTFNKHWSPSLRKAESSCVYSPHPRKKKNSSWWRDDPIYIPHINWVFFFLVSNWKYMKAYCLQAHNTTLNWCLCWDDCALTAMNTEKKILKFIWIYEDFPVLAWLPLSPKLKRKCRNSFLSLSLIWFQIFKSFG